VRFDNWTSFNISVFALRFAFLANLIYIKTPITFYPPPLVLPIFDIAFSEDDFWLSGDAGHIDQNGYLKITDRIKDVIKSSSEWISSIDLENAIMAHPDILEASVVGIPHPKYQERPLPLVVGKPGTILSKGEVLLSIGSEFAKWQLPDKVIFVDEILKTSVDKFSKKDIREQFKDFYTK
jgi:fatty-acyl-CoA synthase